MQVRHASAIQLIADIESAKRQFNLSLKDSSREEDFNKVAERVLRAIRRGSQFSGDMRFIMRGQRSNDHPWIDDLLQV